MVTVVGSLAMRRAYARGIVRNPRDYVALLCAIRRSGYRDRHDVQ
jgi:hypothetical protein